jgi:site-specific recombinase XerD
MKTTFEAYLRDKGLIDKTVKVYCKKIQDFTGWMGKEGLTTQSLSYTDLLRYVRWKRSTGSGKRYVNQLLGIIRHWLSYHEQAGIVAHNVASNLYVRGTGRRMPHDLLSQQELEQIYNACRQETTAEKRNKAMTGLFVFQGLAAYELSMLTRENLKLSEGKVQVPGTCKSNGRTLELRPCQVYLLTEYVTQVRQQILNQAGKESDRLFVSLGSGSSLGNAIAKMMKKLREQFPKLKNPSQLRSSVIVNWLQHHNLRQVQYMAGHRYVSSTEYYRQENLEDLQRELDRYHPLK